jgi:integrase
VKNNWLWFRGGIRALLAFKPLASARLDAISNELAAEFASYRLAKDMQVSTVNSSLRVLRRILRLAVEWGATESAPKISLLPGERHRETVVTPEQERRYLEHAPEPLRSIATVLADTGLRPDECYSLRWEDLNWSNGRNGTLLITHGKTTAARRLIPMTPRVRFVLETHWEDAQKPAVGWVWPAPTRKGHIDHSSLKKQHARAFLNANKETKGPHKLTPWVLYAFRHTFLTRLGESGCDAWTLARIAGHSSIAISSRYVHPSEDVVLNAMERLSGHKIGHSSNILGLPSASKPVQIVEGKEEEWCARRDSNSRPNAPEAFALSS